MAGALRNLAFVLLVCATGLGGTWFYLRNSALSNPIRPPMEHPFLSAKFPAAIAYGQVSPTAFPERRIDLADLKKLPGAVIAWLPVSLNQNGEPEVRGSAGVTPLKKAVETLAGRRLILDLLENRPGTVEQILKSLEGTDVATRVLIQSPVDRLIKDLREAQPRWIFGTSLALTTRLKMMASVGLEATIPIAGDVLVIEQLPKNLNAFTTDVINEAHRRHLRVFAGPVDTEAEAKTLLARGADAVMLTFAPNSTLAAPPELLEGHSKND